MPRRLVTASIFLFFFLFSVVAQAQEGRRGDWSLSAIIGGALPYSSGDGGYLVTRLVDPDEDGRTISFARQSPFGPRVKTVFDARPQVGLGTRYELGQAAGVTLALRAMVSAGMEQPAEGERPLLGLARLSLSF